MLEAGRRYLYGKLEVEFLKINPNGKFVFYVFSGSISGLIIEVDSSELALQSLKNKEAINEFLGMPKDLQTILQQIKK